MSVVMILFNVIPYNNNNEWNYKHTHTHILAHTHYKEKEGIFYNTQ